MKEVKDYDVLCSTVYCKKEKLKGKPVYVVYGNEFAGIGEEICPVRKMVIARRAKVGILLVIAQTSSESQARSYVKQFNSAGAVATVKASSFIGVSSHSA